MDETLQCDLVIVGAGYAGINALNSAAYYLPKGARVVVIAKEHRWGGQWLDAYEYVRLHQPHVVFTVGNRPWKLKRDPSYRATRDEIVSHLQCCAEECVEENKIDLIKLFGYTYRLFDDDSDGVLSIKALPTSGGGGDIQLYPKRLIVATGNNITLNKALKWKNPKNSIHSLGPADVLNAKSVFHMRFGEGTKDKPIFIIGNGKTALDVMNALLSNIPGVSSRLRCVTGRGMNFLVREECNNSTWWIPLLEMFNGTNEQECLTMMRRTGKMHSIVDDPVSFFNAYSSREEIQNVRKALGAESEGRLIRGHLIMEEDGSVAINHENPALQIRPLDKTVAPYTLPIPKGSYIINCTDQIDLLQQVQNRGLLSHNSRVCYANPCFGQSGISANMITHLFMLGILEDALPNIPRIEYSDNKGRNGVLSMFIIVCGLVMVQGLLPKEVKKLFSPPPPIDPPKPGDRELLRNAMPRLMEKMYELMPSRFTKL